MKCSHTNCLTCPYPDCISETGPMSESDATETENRPKKKRGRKKLDPEVKKQRARDWQKQYYYAHKKEHAIKAREYYHKNKEHILEKQRQRRAELNGDTRVREFLIWVTNGTEDKRIKDAQYDEYVAKGYRKGRTLKPYKNAIDKGE